MTQPPYPPGSMPGFNPQGPAPSIWLPVVIGTMISCGLTWLEPCANLTCLCCGLGLWPGVLAGLAVQARRDPGMRVQDGGVIGFVIGGLTGLMRAAAVMARGGIALSPEEVKETLDHAEKLTKQPISPEQRRAAEDALASLLPYVPWITAVVFAVSGIVVGLLIAGMVTASRRRRWVQMPPPPPPPAHVPGGFSP